MRSIIRTSGTILRSPLYLDSRIGFNWPKYLYSVISVIDKRLPGNTKEWTIAPFVDDQSAISRILDGNMSPYSLGPCFPHCQMNESMNLGCCMKSQYILEPYLPTLPTLNHALAFVADRKCVKSGRGEGGRGGVKMMGTLIAQILHTHAHTFQLLSAHIYIYTYIYVYVYVYIYVYIYIYIHIQIYTYSHAFSLAVFAPHMLKHSPLCSPRPLCSHRWVLQRFVRSCGIYTPTRLPRWSKIRKAGLSRVSEGVEVQEGPASRWLGCVDLKAKERGGGYFCQETVCTWYTAKCACIIIKEDSAHVFEHLNPRRAPFALSHILQASSAMFICIFMQFLKRKIEGDFIHWFENLHPHCAPIFLCTYVYIYIWIFINICICIYICIYMYMYMYMYIYVYEYTYIYMYVYV